MKVLFLFFYTSIITAITLSAGYAADYYLSSETGNDDRSMEEAQNPNTPWKSIEKVNTLFDKLKPGDAVMFKRGETFFGTLHLKASGSSTSPIKIGAYGTGPKPIITSFQTINGWKSVGNGIYESTAPINSNAVQVLLINGLLQNMGRYPNAGNVNDGYLTITQTGNNVIYNDQLNTSSNWTGGEVVIRARDWIINRYKIGSHSGNQIQYNGAISQYKSEVGYGFFIQNHLRTLDLFGEWYYNPTSKKINVYLGNVSPSEMVIKVSTLDHLLTKNYNASNITIENIKFNGANGSTIYFEGGKNINIVDSEIEYSGEDGIQALSVSHLEISRSSIKHTYNNGIYLRYNNNEAIIRENEISNTSLFAGRTRNDDQAGVGIFVSGENILVQYNSVVNTGFNGIQFNGNNVLIRNNYVAQFCQIKSDGGGIYTYGGRSYRSFKGRKIEGNIVTNGMGALGGIPKRSIAQRPLVEGIFLDDNSNNIDVVGNSIGKTANSGLKMSNVSDINVINNTFFDSHYTILLGNNVRGQDTRKVKIFNNQFFTKLADQHSVFVTTHKNDIAQMADFDNNYYFRPLSDKFSILNRFTSDGKIEEAFKDLDHWRAKYGKDQNSISNEVDISTYTIGERIGDSLFPNSSFDKNVIGASCNCQHTWEANSKLTGGALKVSSPSSSSVKIDLGELKKDKKYLLKFNAYADKKGSLRLYLRYSGSPWERLSAFNTFEVSAEIGTFETVVSPYIDASEVSLMIAVSESNFTYLLDDLEIVEVEASLINPEDVMLFEHNPTKSSKSLTLAGTYVNTKLEKYSGRVTIPPYGSVALFRVSQDSVVNPNLESLHYHIGNKGTIEFNDLDFKELKTDFHVFTSSNLYVNVDASNEVLFQSERYSTLLDFHIPVENGTYTVKTYHNELYFGKGGPTALEGNRVFDILLEDQVVKHNFDIFKESNNEPTTLTFEGIEIKDGLLDLRLKSSINNASISAISIIREKKSGAPGSDHDFVEEIIEDSLIRIFPNPAKESATLEINAVTTNGSVFIHNMNGQLVSSYDLNRLRISGTKFNIPIYNLSPGIYQIIVTNEDNLIYKKRLIVNK